MEDLLTISKQNVRDIGSINRDLIEKALLMRCHSYYSRVKEQLLVLTLFEFDSSKKNLMKLNNSLESQRDIILRQKEELEAKNRELEELQRHLEQKVKERTSDLEKTNEHLLMEMNERQRIEKEKEKVLQQLFQAQKMESVGRLAGGVAHDFNNLLTAIMGFSHLALQKLPPDNALAKDLNTILEAGERGARLVRQLMVFSRNQSLEMKLLNLNQVIENMMKILGRMIREDIEIKFIPVNELRNIIADVGQMEQILLNLVINASDAISCKGMITIETSNEHLDEHFVKIYEGLKPGPYIKLAVSDTGDGIPLEIQGRIFEPFFTTKSPDRGTGLGLATVHGIIKQHNGHIMVYSEPGVGTTFKIYLPVSGETRTETVSEYNIVMPRGREIILVVDDDPSIRRLVSDTLHSLGYRVLESPNADEAIDFLKNKPGIIDLLLTDVIMHGKNGIELRNWFLNKFPDSKVIFMSGYTGSILEGSSDSSFHFLQKPFSPSQLAGKIRTVLDNA